MFIKLIDSKEYNFKMQTRNLFLMVLTPQKAMMTKYLNLSEKMFGRYDLFFYICNELKSQLKYYAL
jgi:hypothetical protein